METWSHYCWSPSSDCFGWLCRMGKGQEMLRGRKERKGGVLVQPVKSEDMLWWGDKRIGARSLSRWHKVIFLVGTLFALILSQREAVLWSYWDPLPITNPAGAHNWRVRIKLCKSSERKCRWDSLLTYHGPVLCDSGKMLQQVFPTSQIASQQRWPPCRGLWIEEWKTAKKGWRERAGRRMWCLPPATAWAPGL
jgi:hypothetical protein